MAKDLIPLQAANAYQESTRGEKTPWVIRENVTGDILFEFSPNISESVMFEILEFARKFELLALNIGIQFQKTQQDGYLLGEVKRLTEEGASVRAHSDMLAEKLDKLTKGE